MQLLLPIEKNDKHNVVSIWGHTCTTNIMWHHSEIICELIK